MLLSAIKTIKSSYVIKTSKKSEKNFDDTKPKINFSKSRIEKIRKKFNESKHKFSKSKINEIRRNLYEIKNKKNLFVIRVEETEKNLHELEKNLSKTKKYHDNDDSEYKRIRSVRNLFDLSTDEDYYKPMVLLIITIFNMKVKEIKNKY